MTPSFTCPRRPAVGHHPQVLEHLLTLLVKAAPRFRELNALVCAQKQTHPQLVLQQGQLTADGGLGDMKFPGCPGNTLGFGYCGKIFKLSKIHCVSPYLLHIAS